MDEIEAVDEHVRLLARWDDRDRIVFVSNAVLEEMAQKRMNRSSSERFVFAHRQEIIDLAMKHAALRPIGLNKIIVIDELIA